MNLSNEALGTNATNTDQPESNVTSRTRMSASVGDLFTALAKARAKFSTVKKENVNPFFKSKYADLSVVIDATFKALSENGLSVVQLPSGVSEDGLVRVTTLVCHSSGQWLESEITMPVGQKNDAQGIGSAITYARRYAYQAVLNVAAEADDDGSAAVSKSFERTSPELHRKAVGQERVSKIEAKAFRDLAKANHSIEAVVAKLEKINGYRNSDEIQRQHYKELMDWAGKKSMDSVDLHKAVINPASQGNPMFEDEEPNSDELMTKCSKHGMFPERMGNCPTCELEDA